MYDYYDNDEAKCKFCGLVRRNIWRLADHVRWDHPKEYNKSAKERSSYYSKYYKKLCGLKNILNLKKEEEL